MPVRLAEDYIGCVGATKVVYTYTSSAPAVSSKDKYSMIKMDGSLEPPKRTVCVYDSRIGQPKQEKGK